MGENQHYVPRFHLAHFATAGTETLHAYDKSTGRQFPSNITNLACERGFYDWTFEGEEYSAEKKLGNLEGAAAGVVGRIVQDESLGALDDRDRVVLASYVALQHLRVRQFRTQLHTIRDHIRGWLQGQGVDPRDVANFGDPSDEDVRRGSIVGLRAAKDLVPAILSKVWVLQRAAAGRTFYLSDNPVTRHNSIRIPERGNLGIECEGIEVHMPLASRLNLWMLCPSLLAKILRDHELAQSIEKESGIRPDAMGFIEAMIRAVETGCPIEMLPANMDHNNSLQVIYSSRFVYSGEGDFELGKEMCDRDPSLRENGRGLQFA